MSVCICAHVYMYAHMDTRMYACMHVFMYACIHVYACMHTAYIHIHATFIYTYACIHSYTRTRTYTHIYIHAYIHTGACQRDQYDRPVVGYIHFCADKVRSLSLFNEIFVLVISFSRKSFAYYILLIKRILSVLSFKECYFMCMFMSVLTLFALGFCLCCHSREATSCACLCLY
jgi:hypothetical protein